MLDFIGPKQSKCPQKHSYGFECNQLKIGDEMPFKVQIYMTSVYEVEWENCKKNKNNKMLTSVPSLIR